MGRNVHPVDGIPFTQFLLPDGRRNDVWMRRPAEIQAKAQRIIDSLFRFECELLTTGQVHLTISDDFGDYAHEIAPNEPDAPSAAVDRMILGFNIADALEQRKKNV